MLKFENRIVISVETNLFQVAQKVSRWLISKRIRDVLNLETFFSRRDDVVQMTNSQSLRLRENVTTFKTCVVRKLADDVSTTNKC